MLPIASITKTDGNLGVTQPTDRILAVVGYAPSGSTNQATSVTDKNTLTTTFGSSGIGVEAVSYLLNEGVPCVFINPTCSTAATYGAIGETGVGGTANGFITAGTTHPSGDYDVIVTITLGGTTGTGPITWTYSLDNGVTTSLPQSLGTGLTFTLDSGVSFAVSTGKTFLTGDVFTCTTTPPKMSSSDLVTAFAALTSYAGEWLRVLALSVDATDTIMADGVTFAASFHSQGKYPEVILNTRARNVASSESFATYLGVLAPYSAAVQSAEVTVCADQCEIVSLVSGRRLRLPPAIAVAARLMTNDDSHDAAAKADGALDDVFLTTASGAANYVDERKTPGLDALGYTTLRTWGGRPISPGAYINNARLLAGPLSDYQFFQESAIENRIIEEAYQLLSPMLSMSVLLDPATGFIRPDVADSIENTITAHLRNDFKDPGRVSDLLFQLSRTDNLLSTFTLTFKISTVPLGYVKFFTGKSGLARILPSS
jgi:hypothetical protein